MARAGVEEVEREVAAGERELLAEQMVRRAEAVLPRLGRRELVAEGRNVGGAQGVDAAVLVAVSHLDDLYGLPIAVRLGAQAAAAAGFAFGAFPTVALPSLVLIVIGILWMTNLYNFMDGSDGLAGGMAVIARISILRIITGRLRARRKKILEKYLQAISHRTGMS